MPRCEVPEEKASQASRGGSSGDGGSEKRPPLLAIEWHRFSFAFNGDFKIRDLPVRLSPASESRPSSLQEDADTGRVVWDASVVLSRFLEKNLSALLLGRGRAGRPKWILELGAGRGLVGFSAAAAISSEARRAKEDSEEQNFALPPLERQEIRVALTDLPYCLSALRMSASLNNFVFLQKEGEGTFVPLPDGTVRISIEALDWKCPESSVLFKNRVSLEDVALVVASDVLWLKELVPPFVKTLRFFARRSSAAPLIFIAHQCRSKATDSLFFQELAQQGLKAKRVALDEIPEASLSRAVELLSIEVES